MGKPQTQRAKVTYPAGSPTPSVEAQYQVSWLIGDKEGGKNGQWVNEEQTRTSKGRKALMKTIKGTKTRKTYRVRKVA